MNWLPSGVSASQARWFVAVTLRIRMSWLERLDPVNLRLPPLAIKLPEPSTESPPALAVIELPIALLNVSCGTPWTVNEKAVMLLARMAWLTSVLVVKKELTLIGVPEIVTKLEYVKLALAHDGAMNRKAATANAERTGRMLDSYRAWATQNGILADRTVMRSENVRVKKKNKKCL
jgi:hypothetical protein